MDKFVPFEKLSKKKKRELLTKQRQTWGGFSPVTRKPDDPKIYKREKARKRYEDSTDDVPFSFDKYNLLM